MLRLPECGVYSGRSEEEPGREKSCQRDRKDGSEQDTVGHFIASITLAEEETKDLLLKVLDGEMDKDAVMEAMGM